MPVCRETLFDRLGKTDMFQRRAFDEARPILHHADRLQALEPGAVQRVQARFGKTMRDTIVHLLRLEAIASGLEAIASRLEAIAGKA